MNLILTLSIRHLKQQIYFLAQDLRSSFTVVPTRCLVCNIVVLSSVFHASACGCDASIAQEGID